MLEKQTMIRWPILLTTLLGLAISLVQPASAQPGATPESKPQPGYRVDTIELPEGFLAGQPRAVVDANTLAINLYERLSDAKAKAFQQALQRQEAATQPATRPATRPSRRRVASRAYLWRDGEYTDLCKTARSPERPAEKRIVASQVNAAARTEQGVVVVGDCLYANGAEGAFRYHDGSLRLFEAGVESVNQIDLTGVNEAGILVGTRGHPDLRAVPIMVKDGEIRELDRFEKARGYSYVAAINNADPPIIVGGFVYTPFRYVEGEMTEIEPESPDTRFIHAVDVNAQGTVLLEAALPGRKRQLNAVLRHPDGTLETFVEDQRIPQPLALLSDNTIVGRKGHIRFPGEEVVLLQDLIRNQLPGPKGNRHFRIDAVSDSGVIAAHREVHHRAAGSTSTLLLLRPDNPAEGQ
jgi:hypothetical protein